ncbi:hypothetical protein Tco_0080641 [Tanacetum coccineum]
MNIKISLVPPELSPSYRCIRTELITPNLICPSTYQLLRSSGGDSGPDISFDKSASPERRYAPTVIEDNAACISQLKDEYIKGDITKHSLPKFLFTHNLQKSGDIIVQQIRSSDNLADLYTKALPTATFKNLVHDIRMRRLKELK